MGHEAVWVEKHWYNEHFRGERANNILLIDANHKGILNWLFRPKCI